MSAIVGIDHVQLAMPFGQEDAADRFYRDLLGMASVAKPPALAARGGCWYQAGNVQVHLGVEEPFSPARKAHPGLVVNDLAALVARLAQGGVGARHDHELSGVDRAFVDDPFGNRIEFVQRVERQEGGSV